MSATIYEINRKHTLNQTFFDTIDTEAKAYFLGLLWADGCLSVYQQQIKKWNINKQEFSLTGNEQLLLALKQILEKSANVSNKIKLKRYKRTNKAVSLRYGKKTRYYIATSIFI